MPLITKTPVIGFIRYSCRASFDRTGGVFDPEYLKYRLTIFKNITLKSFQNMSDMGFHLFLLHSVNLPEEYKLNDAHSLLLLPGRGGLQTINGNNIMNALDFGRVPAFSHLDLQAFLNTNNYTGFDCRCLHICKRRQLAKFFVKTVRFIAKQVKHGK